MSSQTKVSSTRRKTRGKTRSKATTSGKRAPRSPVKLRAALKAWADVLGIEHVLCDDATCEHYARSTSPHGTQPAAVLYPASTEQVQTVVQIAAKFGIGLYPISRGRNWGYGDACAPTDGQAIVDLRRMDRVLEVNTQLGYAVIEPGVTQGQLFEHLRDQRTGLWMDATGAGPDASIVGNTLERGFGHTPLGDHLANTCGMQVVLADGRVLNTGFGHYANAPAHRVYPYGVGPFIDGLFTQSNFGIVTRIGIWLMPKPEAFSAFFFYADDEYELPRIIERLRPLRMAGVINSAMHIANDLRLPSARMRYPWDRAQGKTPLPPELRRELRRELGIGAWNGCGALYGTRHTVAAARKAVAKALRGYHLHFLDDRRLAMLRLAQRALAKLNLGDRLNELLNVVDPVYCALKGEPSREHLRGASWRVRGADTQTPADPLDASAGLMWVSPVLPATGSDACKVMKIIEPIYARHGFEALVTFTMITQRAMCCVSNLAFDKRQKDEAKRAGACYDELLDTLIDAGYPPYRTSPAGARKLGRGSSVFWDVKRQIKDALDPKGVIAPGRYEPDE